MWKLTGIVMHRANTSRVNYNFVGHVQCGCDLGYKNRHVASRSDHVAEKTNVKIKSIKSLVFLWFGRVLCVARSRHYLYQEDKNLYI